MRWMMEFTSCFPPSNSTTAFSVARLTLASTPSSWLRFFSMRAAHAAQVMPSTSSSTCSTASLHKQHRDGRQVDHLGRGRAEQRVGGGGHAARADEDQVAARGLGVLDRRLGDRSDQQLCVVAHAGRVELLLRRRQPLLAFLLVVLLRLALADADGRQRQVHRDQLDLGLAAVPVGVLDERIDRGEAVLRPVDGEQDFHFGLSPVAMRRFYASAAAISSACSCRLRPASSTKLATGSTPCAASQRLPQASAQPSMTYTG